MTPPRTVYLDTGNLSTLAVARDGTRGALQRDRLRALLVAGRAQLLVSEFNLVEMAKRPEVFERAAPLLQGVPNVMLVLGPNGIFEAELRGQRVYITAATLDAAALSRFHIPTSVPGFDLTPRMLGRLWHGLGRLWEIAEDTGKWAMRHDKPESAAIAASLLRGEVPDGLPFLVRPGAALLAAVVRRGHARGGILGAQIDRMADPTDGLQWARLLAPDVRFPTGPTTSWASEDMRRMPATALRGAVDAGHRVDLGRGFGSGTLADVHHLAFVAHADVATVDKAIFDLTKAVRDRLGRAIFKNGQLDAVLDHLERGGESKK